MEFRQWMKKIVSNFKRKQHALETKKERELAAIEQKYSYLIKEDENIQDSKKKNFGTKDFFTFRIIGLLVVCIGYMAYSMINIIYLILTAFIISMIMDASIVFFSKKMSRGLAITLAYFIVLLFLALILFIVAPFFFTQLAYALNLGIAQVTAFQHALQTHGLSSIIQNNIHFLPDILKEPLIRNVFTSDFVAILQTGLQNNISQIISTGTGYVTSLGSFAVKIITSLFMTISQGIMIFILAVFFSMEKDQVVAFFSSIAGDHKNHVYVKLQRMYAKLGLWIKGQVIVCVYVGAMVGFMFLLSSWILRVNIPSIGTLAIIAGLMNFIPYIGAFIGMGIAFFVVLLAAGWKIALLTLGLYILVNQSENNILTPIIMNKTLGVSALLIFICMLLGGALFGFMGVLLAVPISVIISLAFGKEHITVDKK